MGPASVVGLQAIIEGVLILRDRLLRPAPDPEMLFEERAVEGPDEAGWQRPADLGGAVLELLELQEC